MNSDHLEVIEVMNPATAIYEDCIFIYHGFVISIVLGRVARSGGHTWLRPYLSLSYDLVKMLSTNINWFCLRVGWPGLRVGWPILHVVSNSASGPREANMVAHVLANKTEGYRVA